MVKVNMGNQKHTSPLKRREEDGSLSWDWKMPMVTQVPIKNRIVRMELHTTPSSTKPGKLVATALIPLFQLMGFSQGVHLPWVLQQLRGCSCPFFLGMMSASELAVTMILPPLSSALELVGKQV